MSTQISYDLIGKSWGEERRRRQLAKLYKKGDLSICDNNRGTNASVTQPGKVLTG